MSCIRRSGSRVIRNAILFISVCIVSLVTVYLTVDFTVKENNQILFSGKETLVDKKGDKSRENDAGGSSINYSALDPEITTTISEIAISLHRAKTHVRGTKTSDSLRHAIRLMDTVLKYLGINKQQLISRKVLPPKNVCPEKYMGAEYGYPMFYNGFEETTCSFSKHLSHLITVVTFIKDDDINTVNKRADLFLKSITDIRNVSIVLATSPNFDLRPGFPETVHFISFSGTPSDGQVWNKLIAEVKTPYVLIARDAEILTEDARLERLLREIEMLQVPVAAGAVRYPNGHWKKGCYQSVHKNFTLRYLEGYDESLHECLFCDYVTGPFVTSKETLKTIPFTESEMDAGLFEDWFLKLTKKGLETIVCPDSMFHIRYGKKDPNWKVFIDQWGLYKYISPQGQTTISDCSNTVKYNASRALSPCRLNEIAFSVKHVMEMCETHGIFAELQEGTTLGAVKLGKTAPWEWDTDLGHLSANFSALLKLGDYLTTQNFQVLKIEPDILILGYKIWNVEMSGQYRLDSETLLSSGIEPTRVFLDGAWLRAPRNPGLASRNRYGFEIYQHAVHWRNTGDKHGWGHYKTNTFPSCDIPGNHDCLDRYNADGNLPYSEPLP